MKKENKNPYQRKVLQFFIGFFVGIGLWGLTLMVLLVLN